VNFHKEAFPFGDPTGKGEARILRLGGLSPGHRGSGAELPAGVQGAEPRWEVRGPPEAESSVAFEAPAEEPNLTLVTDSFLQFI